MKRQCETAESGPESKRSSLDSTGVHFARGHKLCVFSVSMCMFLSWNVLREIV